MEKAGTLIAKALKQITDNSERTVFRFDIFKGAIDANGKVQKLKSVGCGVHALSSGLAVPRTSLPYQTDDRH